MLPSISLQREYTYNKDQVVHTRYSALNCCCSSRRNSQDYLSDKSLWEFYTYDTKEELCQANNSKEKLHRLIVRMRVKYIYEISPVAGIGGVAGLLQNSFQEDARDKG